MKTIADQNTTKAGYRVADSSGIPVASRLQIIDYLSDINRPVVLECICTHFDIVSADGINALSMRLNRMRKNGYVLFDRKSRYGLPEKMDLVVGKVVGHAKGFGFVIPERSPSLESARGDLYLHHNQMRRVLHGDRVLAKTKRIDKQGRKEGVIVEVLVEQNREIIGHFHVEDGIGFVAPDDARFARDISISSNRFNGAKNGDIVVARIRQHPVEHRHAVGEISEIVGHGLQPGMETEIALRKHGISHSWPEAVTHQLKVMADKGDLLINTALESTRKDLRDLPLVTIDASDAHDFDDAVYCEPISSGRRLIGWRLVVAIADVSHYVKPDSALDCEAYARGNSVYFPNRVVPMLPEQLANDICSLKPAEDRHCMVCDMHITNQGTVKHFQFYPALMRSRARLTYDLVNTLVVKKDNQQRLAWEALTPHLDHLYRVSLCLRKNRARRGAIEFEFPEPYIKFDDKKRIRQISIRQRNEAHRLIEECMLVANVCAAEFLHAEVGTSIYRNHDAPDPDTLTDLRKFMGELGLMLGGDDKPEAKDYARLVANVAQRTDIASMVQSVLLRSLSQAVYSTDQTGHFALALPIYCHFTSPIRRYCDVLVHRQIKQILTTVAGKVADKNNQRIAPLGVSIDQIGEHCSFAERRANDATRDAICWLKAEFMQGKVGEQFDGIISGVKEFGIFVQLNDIFVDGLVHVTSLGNDYYHFDSARYQLLGARSGRRFRLGDRARVRVLRVDLDEAKIDFDLVSDSASAKTSAKKALKKVPNKRAKTVKNAHKTILMPIN